MSKYRQMRKCGMCMYANKKMWVVQICKYANEKMSKCRKPQVLGQRSVASPQLGNWLQNLIQHLGISNSQNTHKYWHKVIGNIKAAKYTQILAQNSWEYKIPRIHTNIGTKHVGISNLQNTHKYRHKIIGYQIPWN